MNHVLKNPLLLKISKFIFAFGLIGWMVHKGLIDFSVLALLATPTNIAVALGLGFLNLALSNWRWTLLLRARGFGVNIFKTMPLTLIADFFNFALPGAIGGDVVKGYYIAQENPSRKMEAVTSIIIDRVLGLYAMVLIALTAIIMNFSLILSKPDLLVVSFSTLGVFTLMTMFLSAALSRRLRGLLRMDFLFSKIPGGGLGLKFYDAFQGYRTHGNTLAISMVLGLAAQLVAIFFMVFVGYVIGETNITLSTFLFAVPLGFIVSALPISPAGIGVGQYAFLVLFRMYSGVNTNLGQTSITAFQVVLFAWGLVGGVIYLLKKKPVMQEASV